MVICKLCKYEAQNTSAFGSHFYKHRNEMTMEEYYYQHEVRICQQCGDSIPFRRSGWRERKYCSNACGNPNQGVAGKDHYAYKGRTKTQQGYILLNLAEIPKEDRHITLPMARNSGGSRRSVNGKVVLEHRYVMAKSLGRPLTPSETVHHRNGVRDDNRLENLELWAGKHPPGLKASDICCPRCNYVFDRYLGDD